MARVDFVSSTGSFRSDLWAGAVRSRGRLRGDTGGAIVLPKG